MTRMRVDASGIAALGGMLGDLADYLETRARTSTGGAGKYGFIGNAGQALDRITGDVERERQAVCDDLDALDGLAQDAGGLYFEAESFLADQLRWQR